MTKKQTLRIGYRDGWLEYFDIQRCEFVSNYEETKDEVGAVLNKTCTGYTLVIDVDAEGGRIKKLAEENHALHRRLQHLLQSDYIRSFDEWDPRTKDYKRDIKEADAGLNLRSSARSAAAALQELAEKSLAFFDALEKEGKI